MSYAMHAQGHAYSRQDDRRGAGEVTIATILDNLSKVRVLVTANPDNFAIFYILRLYYIFCALYHLCVSISFD